METLLKNWDGEDVIIRHDRTTGAWIIIAVHNTMHRPARGGTRLKRYPDLRAAVEDALRLSAGMTQKFAVSRFPSGGAKAVMAVPADLQPAERAGLLRRYGEMVHRLGGLFETGPDVGTSSEDMDVIAETGAPYVFCRTPEKGGSGSPGPWTALGVFSGMEAACRHLFGDASLKGRRVLVQGTGSVGNKLIELLCRAGADVMFNDVKPGAIEHFRDELGLTFIPADEVFDTSCDIFSPCALGGILNVETIPRLQCMAVVGGANNQLGERADADRLRQRHILYAPDYAVNIGGAMAVIGIESMGWSREKAEAQVKSVKDTVLHIFSKAAAEGTDTETIARQMADTWLSRRT